MNIKKISLHNYRNFSQVEEIEIPDSALLVAAAPNATGKTNFLESLVMLLRGKSFRASTEECVQWGADSFIVQGHVERGDKNTRLAVRYHSPTRKLRIEEDGVPASLVTFFGDYPLIMFLPEDTFMLARGPAQRRSFMNRILVSSPSYVSALVQYQRVLKQRNAALKKAGSLSDIESWTDLLITHALSIWKQRRNLAEYLNNQIGEMYERIGGEKREFDIKLSGGLSSKEEAQAEIEKSFEYERRYGYTMVGPHRDDLVMETKGRPAAVSLSQGQTRTLVVALKLIALGYVEKITNEQPLLLLDEVLSELDEQRQEMVLRNLPKVQTLMTCTSIPRVLYQRDNVHLLDLRTIIDSSLTSEQEPSQEKTEEAEEEGAPAATS